MFGSSNRESLNTPRLWHSRAGGGSRPRHHKRKSAISFGPLKRRAAEMYVPVVNSIQTLLSLLRRTQGGCCGCVT